MVVKDTLGFRQTVFLEFRKFLCVLTATVLTGGCDKVVDVSDTSAGWGTYKRDTAYKLRQDVFLLKVDSDRAQYALVPEGRYKGKVRKLYPRPVSVKEYHRSKEIVYKEYIAYNTPVEVVSVIRSGSVVKPVKLKYFNISSWFFGTAEFYRVYGRLEIPEFDALEVDLEDLSSRDFGCKPSCCRNHAPNPELLEVLTPNNSHRPASARTSG